MRRIIALIALMVISVFTYSDMLYATSVSRLQRAGQSVELAGHRGLVGKVAGPKSKTVDENTIASCKNALSKGATTCEFDMHKTSDGVLMVIHDNDLSRTTNCVGLVSESTRAWINANCLTAHGGRVVTVDSFFAKVLEEFPKAHFQGEIKPELAAEMTAKLVTSIQKYHLETMTTITSSRIGNLSLLETTAPAITKGLIQRRTEPVFTIEYLASQRDTIDMVVIPEVSATTDYINRVHQAGFRVGSWTAKGLPELKRLTNVGVDVLITDYADVYDDWRDGRS